MRAASHQRPFLDAHNNPAGLCAGVLLVKGELSSTCNHALDANL